MLLSLGLLYLAGSLLGGLSLVLPHAARANEAALAANTALAGAAGATVVLGRAALPHWLAPAGLVAGAALISIAILFSGDPHTPYAVMYTWVVLYSAYFFGPRAAAGCVVLVGALLAIVLAIHPQAEAGMLTAWLLTVIGLGVGAALISYLVRARDRAESSRRHLAALVENSADAIYGIGLDGTIETWNLGAERLYGYRSGEVIGRSLAVLIPEEVTDGLGQVLSRLREGDKVENYETVRRRKDGRRLDVSLTISPILDPRRVVIGGSLIARDISSRKDLDRQRDRLLQRSQAMARTDPLTGLANRRAWDEELRGELARAQRRNWPVCVALIDLDHFKLFNDERGHLAGDELLREAAATWRVVLRVSDTIARIGGEEFALLLPDCGPGDASQVIERLRASTPLGQTCSAGLALWDGQQAAGELMARADEALYEAKRGGRDRLAIAA